MLGTAMATYRNQDLAEAFDELAELTILDEGDPQSFRVRAYENAARAIAGADVEAATLTLAQLQKLEGIGKSGATKVRELVDTGRMAKLEELRLKHPLEVRALAKLPGIGPKTVTKLRAEANVHSIDDLRAAIVAQKIRTIKGLSAKTEAKFAQVIAELDAQGVIGRTPISVALPLARRLVEQLRQVPGVEHVSYAGSLRRFRETVGDIDLLVAATDPAAVMETFVGFPQVDRVLVRGETKTSLLTRRGTQIDLRVVAAHQIGAAQLYFTGSKAHNVALRQRALSRGWTLNEYALAELDGGKVIASETEEAIYAALGLAFVPPTLREGAGEIEAAERGQLPAPFGAVNGDFHVHTTTSGDGQSTLDEMVEAALARGYRVLAITDHAEGTVSGAPREAFELQHARIVAWREKLGDRLLLLHGAELNIGPNGELDYDAEFRARFDFCVASVHDHMDLPREQQTARIVRAMHDPAVRSIGHLSARMIGARPGIDLDYDAIVEAAAQTGTALEVNGALPRLDLSEEALRRAAKHDVKLLFTSDAHHVDELGNVAHAATYAARAWVDPARVLNTGDPARLLEWLKSKSS